MADTSLRASVTFVNLSRTATYVVPVSEIDYILLASSARMDTSGLFRFNGETIGIADNSVLSFSKPLADTAVFSDASVLSFVTTKTEAVTASDSSSLSHALGKTETVSAVDTNALAFTFGTVAEDVTISDASTLDAQKSVSDTVTSSDAAVVTLIFLRDIFDTTTLSDTPSLSFTPETKTDTVTSGDANSYSFNQFLTEAFAMNDLADIGDGISFDFVDFTANVVTITDAATVGVDISTADSFSLADAGVGSMQDYCDITYFAEDYVGTRFTF